MKKVNASILQAGIGRLLLAMTELRKLIQRGPTIFFLSSAILLTYVLGVAIHLCLRTVQKMLGFEIPGLGILVMKFGPSLAGVLTIALIAGRYGLKNLFQRCIRWRFSVLLYLLAILVQPLILLIVLLIRGFGSQVLSVHFTTAIKVFAVQMLLNLFLGGGLGEELGWRGFMLPQVSQRFSSLIASLLVGIAWFVWHIPAYVFFNKGASDPLMPFVVITFPFSIIFAWLYFISKESLLLPILLHSSINASFYAIEELLPEVVGATNFQPGFDWIVAGIWCLFAAIVLAMWGFNLAQSRVE